MGKSYIIITVAKNEERNLPLLAESMVKQTIKPAAWFIFDDGSDDRTPEIIAELENKFYWIHGKRLTKSQVSNIRELNSHFVWLTKMSFDYALDFCATGGIEYEYIGKVDADMVLPPDYFERIVERFEQNRRLGVAGGHYINAIPDGKGNMIRKRTPPALMEDGPSGGCIIIKRDCFQEMGGIPLTPGAQDGAILAKARISGWETRRFSDIEIFHLRKRGSAKWDGYIAYCADYHPLLVLLNCLMAPLVTGEPFRGLVYLYGYFSALLKKEPKVADESLRHYFRHKRLEEVRQRIGLKKKNMSDNF